MPRLLLIQTRPFAAHGISLTRGSVFFFHLLEQRTRGESEITVSGNVVRILCNSCAVTRFRSLVARKFIYLRSILTTDGAGFFLPQEEEK